MLAAESSVPTWRRVMATGTTVGGVELPAEAPLLLRLTGTGGPSDLAFGLGLHRCLGAGLARMEARVAVQQAATTLTGLRLVEPDPPMIDLLSFKGPRRVSYGRPPRRGRSTASVRSGRCVKWSLPMIAADLGKLGRLRPRDGS